MNVVDTIKHIIDTNDITDQDILSLREYFSSIFTLEESKAWEEANEMGNEQLLKEQLDDPYFEGHWECNHGTLHTHNDVCNCDEYEDDYPCDIVNEF